jgi:hypothetical protein
MLVNCSVIWLISRINESHTQRSGNRCQTTTREHKRAGSQQHVQIGKTVVTGPASSHWSIEQNFHFALRRIVVVEWVELRRINE